jgi:hypothetical protein
MSNASDNDEPEVVSSLRDLPRSIEPSRDLWAGIEAKIAAEREVTRAQSTSEVTDLSSKRSSSARNLARLRWMAAAAMIAALAVGMWIGRSSLPTGGPPPGGQMAAGTNPPGQPGVLTPPNNTTPGEGATTLQAAYVVDPKFRQQREALVKSLEAKLASLPPESRSKVLASLATIHQSMQVLEEELGKDPTNALLQELLLNTYQDEMRVLTTVHEASDAGKGV